MKIKAMIKFIAALFGYCKIPLQVVQLSMMQEDFIKKLIRHESDERGKEFYKKMLIGQQAITEFLRSGKILRNN